MEPTNKGNIQVKCPKCEEEYNEDGRILKKLKLAIDVDTHDRFHCWTCGFKGWTIVRLLRKYKSSFYAEYLKRFATEEDILKDEDIEGESVKKVVLPDDFQLLATADYGNFVVRESINYLKERGVRYQDLWYYKFGISKEWPWKNRVVMPSFDENGKLNYLCGRDITGKQKFKYCDSDVPKKNIVFNDLNIDWTKEVTITEGIFDLIKCNRNSVPVLGSDLSFRSMLFLKIAQNNTPVLLAFDKDMRDSKLPKVVKMLMGAGIKVRVLNYSLLDGHDVGEASRKGFVCAKAQAEIWDFETRLKDKLSRITTRPIL